MNRLSFLGLALLLTFSATAQTLRFSDALAYARKLNRMIFIDYQPVPCPKCESDLEAAVRDSVVMDRLAEKFVPLELNPQHPDFAALKKKYELGDKPRYYFIDTAGRLVHSFASVNRSSDLDRELEMALTKGNAHSRLGTYEKAYENGDRSPKLLEALLLERRSLGFTIDSLLDEYAASLPPDSLRSARVLQFIGGMAPLLGSRADAVFRGDQLRFDHAWYVLPMRTRVQLNNEIIAKSKRRAIADGNEAYAIAVAGFAQSTYVGDTAKGMRAYEKLLLDFYRETRDTAHYLPVASSYYERYLMRQSIDSLKRADSSFSSTDSPPPSIAFSRELTNAAYTIYVFSTDPDRLAQAAHWVEAAMRAWTYPDQFDVYARLLYVQGRQADAFASEQAAIDLLKKQRRSSVEKEAVLEGMKKGKLDRTYHTVH